MRAPCLSVEDQAFEKHGVGFSALMEPGGVGGHGGFEVQCGWDRRGKSYEWEFS